MEGKIAAKLTQNFTLNRRKMLFSAGLAFFLFSVSFALGATAQAASLYFSPSAGSYQVGKTFSVSVYVESPGQAMNAASGVISFPQDKLEITSLAKTGSIISLWVQEPSFSNSVGTINFEGIVLNPGFSGSNGKIITLNFKAKSAGNALLRFASGSVLANDGKGTNILTGLGTARFDLNVPATGPAAPEATTPTETTGVPLAPKISSPTNPDPENWYSEKNPKFTWESPSDVTGVRLLYDKYPTSRPVVAYSPPISEKQLENIEDGIYYFHVQFRNRFGWGAISHFRFQIDTQPPEPFSIKFIDGKETENPRPTVIFDTTDSLSGVEYYKIKAGEGDFDNLPASVVKDNPYTLPPQNPGKRSILVQAFDKAGNYSAATEEFTIKALKEPVFTEYPRELQSGQILIIKGQTDYPESEITLWLQREYDKPQSQITKANKDGQFSVVIEEKLRDGIYKIWAEVTDQRGAKSSPSEQITIAVAPPALLKIGNYAIGVLSVIIPLISLIAFLTLILWYNWYRFARLRKKLKKEVYEAQRALQNAFKLLKGDITEQIKILEKVKKKQPLTAEEEETTKQFKEDLDEAEKYIKKEIGDIEKRLK